MNVASQNNSVPGLNVGVTAQKAPPAIATDPNTSSSSFIKPAKKNPFNLKVILGVIILALTIIGAIAGFYLTQVNQDVRQQAFEEEYSGGGTETLGAGSCIPATTPQNQTTTFVCSSGGSFSVLTSQCESGQRCKYIASNGSCFDSSTKTCQLGITSGERDIDGNFCSTGQICGTVPNTQGCSSFSKSVCDQLNSCHWNSTGDGGEGSCENGPPPATSNCLTFSESVCKQLSSCHWSTTTNNCQPGAPEPTPPPVNPTTPTPTGCASFSESVCKQLNSCTWNASTQTCRDNTDDTGSGGPTTPSTCSSYHGNQVGCLLFSNTSTQYDCEYNTSTNMCITKVGSVSCGDLSENSCNLTQNCLWVSNRNECVDRPAPTNTPAPTNCNQYHGQPQLCGQNGCTYTSTGLCQSPDYSFNCREYDNNEFLCNQQNGCEYESPYCQAEGEGPTYGNPGECRDINGNLTDAVCYACDGVLDPSGGCQGRVFQTFIKPGNVPNASQFGSEVNNCGIVQCDCKGTGAGSGYAIPLVFTSQIFTSQCSEQVTKYACVNGTCQETTGSGYPTMPMCQENCVASTPVPTTPPGGTPVPTPPPTVPPVTYQCNSRCQTDAQCQTADNRFRCLDTNDGKRCRLNTNPTSAQCQPVSGPQCLNITMNNVTRPETPVNTEPTIGDAVRFTCGQVAAAQRYVFRIFGPTGEPTILESTGNVSEPFTILSDGPYSAQCQICTGQDDSTCLPFEAP